MDLSLPQFLSFFTLPTSACLGLSLLSTRIFVDTNVVVLAFTHLVRFDLGRKVLEGNRTLCREGDALIVMIPTIHGTFFRGLTVIVLLVPIYDLHSRAVNYTKNR